MENSRPCKGCGHRALVSDDYTGNLVCSSCGIVQDFDNFQAHFGGISGPTGTFVRVGTAGSGNAFNYREKKILEAQKLIDELMFKLGFSDSRTNEVRIMVETITEGEYGRGDWFPTFIGACAYVVMRRDNKSLPMVEVAALIGCEVHELGRMVGRVVDFLGLKLPDFDIVNSFKRAIETCPSLSGLSEDKAERMLKQGIFIVQCLVKWFLTTGRRPLPVVVAVLVFVAQLNQVNVKIEDVAKELHVAVSTCRLRYKELLECLVEVAQALPWGKDITIKNIMKNVHFVIQYMELKSMAEHSEKKDLEHVGFDLGDLVSDITSKTIEYGSERYSLQSDSSYFEGENLPGWTTDDSKELKISPQCLSMIYSKFVDEVHYVNSSEASGKGYTREIGRGYTLWASSEWWKGKSNLSKKLLLEQIVEKDVGLDAMPPSFVSGCVANQRRREKITAAKLRIDEIMYPKTVDSGTRNDLCSKESTNVRKRRRGVQVDIDWEDFIIETLLLHQVKEDEIETGHYKALVDLHVFTSGSM